MVSVYELKGRFQNILRPLLKMFVALGITANQVTIFTCFLSLVVGGLIYFFANNPKILFIVPIFLFIRMALNAIDGLLAQEFNMKTNLGAILNELGDVISDTFLYLPFAIIPGMNLALIVLVVILGIISEMTGVIGIQIGASRRYDGPMGKSDRAFWFSIIALGLAFKLVPVGIVNYALFVILFLLVLTIINRCKNALKEVRR